MPDKSTMPGCRAGLITVTTLVSLLAASPCWAQPLGDVDAFRYSADIHAAVDTDNGTLIGADEAIFIAVPGAGPQGLELSLGTMDEADIDGYDLDRFSVDATTVVNGTVMRPADVFGADGTRVLDASGAGIPDGVNVNAVTRDPATGDVVFSIDRTAVLGGTLFDAADLIRFDGSGFSMVLDLPGAGGLNIDAAHWLPDGTFLVSASSEAAFGSIIASDEQVVANPAGDAAVVFTPAHDSWQAADLDALWVDAFTPGQFAWAEAASVVFENAGSATLTVERAGGSEGSTGVSFETVSDTAIAGADFVASSGTVEFDDGETFNTLSIVLLDDGFIEGEERFGVILTGVTAGGTIGSPSAITVIVRDDEDFLFADGFED